MYYEIYVDVFFLVNFAMDYLLLLLVRRILSCTATHGNVCLGAFVGALLTCLTVVIAMPYAWIKVVLFHLCINTGMIFVGLKIREIRVFVKAFVLLYIGAFLLGGILEAMGQYVTMGSLFLAVALAGYYLAIGCIKFVTKVHQWNSCRCKARIFMDGKSMEVTCLLDTGNQLHDPVSGKGVSILNPSTAQKLLGNTKVVGLRYIPYQTIGENAHVLPVFTAEKMQVFAEHNYEIVNPLIGISANEITKKGEYEMILNPNIF